MCAVGGPCVGLVDSGTSLLALPLAVVSEMDPLLNAIDLNCANVEKLPTLYFKLSGRWTAIPPNVYVSRVSRSDLVKAASPTGFATGMKHVASRRVDEIHKLLTTTLSASDSHACVANMMQEETTTTHGPLFILGMPFLRAQAAIFDRASTADTPRGSISVSPLTSDMSERYCSTCTMRSTTEVQLAAADHDASEANIAAYQATLANSLKGNDDGIQFALQPEIEMHEAPPPALTRLDDVSMPMWWKPPSQRTNLVHHLDI